MYSTRIKTTRVQLFAGGMSGVSEPMTEEQAQSWATRAQALYPGLRCRLIDNEADVPAQAYDNRLNFVPTTVGS